MCISECVKHYDEYQDFRDVRMIRTMTFRRYVARRLNDRRTDAFEFDRVVDDCLSLF